MNRWIYLNRESECTSYDCDRWHGAVACIDITVQRRLLLRCGLRFDCDSTAIQLPLDCHSTALRPFDGRYDCRPICVGSRYLILAKQESMLACSGVIFVGVIQKIKPRSFRSDHRSKKENNADIQRASSNSLFYLVTKDYLKLCKCFSQRIF